MPGNANLILSADFLPCPPTPLQLEQRKLDRLRELRAFIDSLRQEPGQDPLLAWAAEQESSRY